MRFVEETGGSWTEQLRYAEAEIEQQKREWEANRLAALRKEEEDAKRAAEEEENQLLTYSGVDARNQVNNKSKKSTANRSSLGRFKSVAATTTTTTNTRQRRRSDIVKSSDRRRSRNASAVSSSRQSTPAKRRSLPATTTVNSRKRKIEDTPKPPAKSRTISRSIPKRLCRQAVNNSRSEPTTDNDVSSIDGNASSNESKKGTSDSIDDDSDADGDDDDDDDEDVSLDECSLDVMYDEQQSESNSVQAPSSSGVDNEKSDGESSDDDDSDNVRGRNEENGNETAKSATLDKRRVSLNNRLDINSPRTRSRGTVKLNLWALDDSPILPSFGGRSKRNQTKSQSNEVNDKSAVADESFQSFKSDIRRSRSNSPTDSGKLSGVEPIISANRRRSRSLSIERNDMTTTTSNRSVSLSLDLNADDDGSNNHLTDRLNDSETTTTPTTPSDRHGSTLVAPLKLAQIKDGLDGSKPFKAKRPPPKKILQKNGKSSSTLDSWLTSSKSPKVILSKDDDAITKHLTNIATRTTRRSSTLKMNAENGPS